MSGRGDIRDGDRELYEEKEIWKGKEEKEGQERAKRRKEAETVEIKYREGGGRGLGGGERVKERWGKERWREGGHISVLTLLAGDPSP